MPLEFTRPDVTDLVLRVFDRPLHPELFECRSRHRFAQGGCRLNVKLSPAGHTIEYEQGGYFLTEAISLAEQDLPSLGRRIEQRVRGCRTSSYRVASEIRYDVSCQLEQLPIDVFQKVHEELRSDSLTAEVAFSYPSSNRMQFSALSILRIEFGNRLVMVHAFHTFPENLSVIRVQSLLEWRS